MKNLLEKTILSAIAGLALSSTVGCSTIKNALNYEPYNDPKFMQEEINLKKVNYNPALGNFSYTSH